MNELMNKITKEETLSSLEVADMIGKRHDNLLADVRGYIKEFSLLDFKERKYFIESTYKNRGKFIHAMRSQRKDASLSPIN